MWRLLADPYSYPLWVTGTARIRGADADWPAPGSRLYHRFGLPLLTVRDASTVDAAQPDRRLVLTARAWPFGVVTAELVLCPLDGGTRIVLREWLHGGVGARLPRLGQRVQRRRLQRSVSLLATLSRPRVPAR